MQTAQHAPSGRQPFLSVVIPAYNEEKLLPRCLDCLHEAIQDWPEAGRPVEVIVCDNASTDQTARIAHERGAKVVAEPVRQISRARNAGAAVATGAWLLFLDADSFPSRELLARMAQACERPDVIGGGALVRLDRKIALGAALTLFWTAISLATRWAPGSFLFCRTEAFRTLGGFSQALFISEELDLSRRLKRLARTRHQRMLILRGAPLLTSGRKFDLYTPAETRAFIRTFFRHPTRVMRTRDACTIWYNGRR